MVKPLLVFRRRRWIALSGALGLGLLVVAALVARFFFPAAIPLFVGLGIALFVGGWLQYRCPFCGRFPEAEIPLFYPQTCCHCGEKLR